MCAEKCKDTNRNIKEIGKNIDALTIEVNGMKKKISELDETLEKTSVSHFQLEAQFKNLAEETAMQRHQLTKLSNDNTIIEEIKEKFKKLEILEFKVNSIFDTIHEIKDTRKEDIEYRINRAKERKEESEKRENERKSTIRWIIGITITVIGLTGTFIWKSLDSGIQIYVEKKIKSDNKLVKSVKEEFKKYKEHQDNENKRFFEKTLENSKNIELIEEKIK